MAISQITRRIIFSVILSILVFLCLTIANGAAERETKSQKYEIDLTKDILVNPILEDRDIWKVDQASFYPSKRDLTKSNVLVKGSPAIEVFIENIYQLAEKPPELVSFQLPDITTRRENLSVDVKSAKEKILLAAAGRKIYLHKVQPEETLWDISHRYGIDLETLIGANQEISNFDQLEVGQEIKVLNSQGLIHKVSYGETLSDISRIYQVSIKDIMSFNDLKNSILHVADQLVIPGARRPKLEFKSGFSTGYIWPVNGSISSPFGPRWGKMHNGIDISVNRGTPVKAARSGQVIYSGVARGYGNVVYIKHDSQTVTRYGHNDKLLVKTRDFVYQGEVIALSGSTGTSTGPHVHFEIRITNKPIDPLKYLKR